MTQLLLYFYDTIIIAGTLNKWNLNFAEDSNFSQ